jgi:hypothetical protein
MKQKLLKSRIIFFVFCKLIFKKIEKYWDGVSLEKV